MPDWHRLQWYGVLAIAVAGAAASAFILFASHEAFGWVALSFCLFGAAMAVHELWPQLIEGRPASPAPILQRYPAPVVLRTPRRKLIFFLISMIVFGGCLLWMALYSDMDAFGLIFMWIGAIGCAAAVPVFLLSIVRGSTLRLDTDGMQIFQGLKRSVHRWSDTGEFAVVDAGVLSPTRNLMVAFDDTTLMDGAVAQFNRSMIGYSGALADTYGMAPEHLAWLLNEWRARALANPPLPPRSSPAP